LGCPSEINNNLFEHRGGTAAWSESKGGRHREVATTRGGDRDIIPIEINGFVRTGGDLGGYYSGIGSKVHVVYDGRGAASVEESH
jgi:hypothetical protein